jgi:hypothetical protein
LDPYFADESVRRIARVQVLLDDLVDLTNTSLDLAAGQRGGGGLSESSANWRT